MHYLSACAIFKDEMPYLFEWLAFHRMVGFEYFYLYDNGSSDDFLAAIHAALPEGSYELISWPQRPGQYPAYNDCLARARGKTRWLAFFDIDEFWFSPLGEDLRPYLKDYEPHPGLAVNWTMFGSSGHQESPNDYVTRAYTRRSHMGFTVMRPEMLKDPSLDPRDINSYFPLCGHYKSVVDPMRTERCFNAHRLLHGYNGPTVTEFGEPVRTMWLPQARGHKFRMNHYWTRSIADLRRKIMRGRVADDQSDDLRTMLEMESRTNAFEDLVIQPLAARLPPMPEFCRRPAATQA